MNILARFNFTVCAFVTLLFAIIAQTASPVHANPINDLVGGNSTKAETASGAQIITTDDTKVSDKKILKRLREIFTELDTLKNIQITVTKGIVSLKGEVASAAIQEQANKLANQVEGVVVVEDKTIVSLNIEKRLETTWNKIRALANTIISNLPLFVLALFIFTLFWLIGRWVSKRQNLFRRLSTNAFIANLLGQITHLIFILSGLILALSLLDATALLGTIMGAAGIFGLAIGFAVRDTVENYIASVLLSLRNPFQINDYVEVDGNEGNVARLTSRATILITSDGNHLRIPNSQVYKAIIVNYTRNTERRFSFDLGVDAAQDLSEAQLLAITTLNSIEGVLDEPKPSALIQELGDFNVIVRVFGWVDQDHYSFGKVRSEAIKKVKLAFDDANIIMPEPIYQIRMSENGLIQASKTHADDNSAPKKELQKNTKITKFGDDVLDIKPDETSKTQIQEEHENSNTENLLSSQTPSE